MRHHLLQQTIILTLLTGVVSLTGACTFSNEKQSVVCDPAVEGSCVVSYNEPEQHLIQDFAAYETAYLPTSGAIALAPGNPALIQPAIIATSEPNGDAGVSVREKQMQNQLADMQNQINAQATAEAQRLAQAEAEALNKVMEQVATATIYFDPTTGQPVPYRPQQVAGEPVVVEQVVQPAQPMVEQVAQPVMEQVIVEQAAEPVIGQVAQPVMEQVIVEQVVQPAQEIVQPMPIDAQIVTTEQPFVTQPGVVVGGNDLEGQIIVTEAPATPEEIKAVEEPQLVAEEPETVEPVEVTLDQRLLYGEDVQDWNAPAGESLRSLLMQWGEQSGWTVIWKLDRDYTLEAGVVFRGTFMEAASAFIRSFARATPAPIGTFYKGNRVLLINTQESDNAD